MAKRPFSSVTGDSTPGTTVEPVTWSSVKSASARSVLKYPVLEASTSSGMVPTDVVAASASVFDVRSVATEIVNWFLGAIPAMAIASPAADASSRWFASRDTVTMSAVQSPSFSWSSTALLIFDSSSSTV